MKTNFYINLKNMSTQKLVFASAFLILATYTQAQPFKITGRIHGAQSGYISLIYEDVNNRKQHQVVIIKKGKFKLEGEVNRIADAIIATDSNLINKDFNSFKYLFLEPGLTKISFEYGNLKSIKYSGAKTQKEYDELRQKKIDDSKLQIIENGKLTSIAKSIKEGAIEQKEAEQQLNQTLERLKIINTNIMNREIDFISNNPSSYLSISLLKDLVGYIPIDSIELLYSTIAEKIKGCNLDNKFTTYFSRYKKAFASIYPFDALSVKMMAPPFTIKADGSVFTNKDYLGKTSLLVFWGLNCLPCLLENPLIEQVRKEYQKEGLQIIGITNTSNVGLPEMHSYIKKNKLTEWIHVSRDSLISKEKSIVLSGDFSNYKGLGIPKTVLIDKKGRIAYLSNGYDMDEFEKLKRVIAEVIKMDERPH